MNNICILGATGLVGSLFLQNILEDNRVDTVYTIGRSKTGLKHKKLIEIEFDLFKLNELDLGQYNLSVLCCCIGTTAKKTPDKELYHKIDFGIPVNAAALCEKYQIPIFQVISAFGADSNSKIFYNRTKGEMENSVLLKKIKHIFILQPSLIIGPRKEYRLGEKLAGILMRFFSFLFVGPLRAFRPIEASQIAIAMHKLIYLNHKSGRIISPEIKTIANL